MRTMLYFILVVSMLITIGCFVVYWVQYHSPMSQHGLEYDVVFTVQRVEKSERWGTHTNVWIETYGETGRVYFFEGHHEFTIGKAYRVVFVDKVHFNILHLPAFWVWGEISLKEVI